MEQGRYDDLIQQNGEFARLIREFGGTGDEEEHDVTATTNAASEKVVQKGPDRGYQAASTLMQEEERVTGAVGFSGKSFDNLL